MLEVAKSYVEDSKSRRATTQSEQNHYLRVRLLEAVFQTLDKADDAITAALSEGARIEDANTIRSIVSFQRGVTYIAIASAYEDGPAKYSPDAFDGSMRKSIREERALHRTATANALRSFQESIRLSPDDSSALFNIGLISAYGSYGQDRDLLSAEAAFKRVVDLEATTEIAVSAAKHLFELRTATDAERQRRNSEKEQERIAAETRRRAEEAEREAQIQRENAEREANRLRAERRARGQADYEAAAGAGANALQRLCESRQSRRHCLRCAEDISHRSRRAKKGLCHECATQSALVPTFSSPDHREASFSRRRRLAVLLLAAAAALISVAVTWHVASKTDSVTSYHPTQSNAAPTKTPLATLLHPAEELQRAETTEPSSADERARHLAGLPSPANGEPFPEPPTPAELQQRLELRQLGTKDNWSTVRIEGENICALGNGKLSCAGPSTPIAIAGDSASGPAKGVGGPDLEWTSVSVGPGHSCAIRAGELYCWTADSPPQPGLVTGPTSKILYRVGRHADWTQVSTGRDYTCAVRAGKLFCWGGNSDGQLGIGSTTEQASPKQVGTATDWSEVSTNRGGIEGSHTCARRSGSLYCWGLNRSGQLGDGTTDDHHAPRQVGQHSDWTSISVGASNTCGIRAGRLYCWGADRLSAYPSRSHLVPTEVPVPDLHEAAPSGARWIEVSVGDWVTCGLSASRLVCWGLLTGLLSDPQYPPTQIGIQDGWSAISVTGGSACAIRNGLIFCFQTWEPLAMNQDLVPGPN